MSAKTARKIKPVPTAEKLIDLAFKKASRQSAPVPRTLPALLKAKRREETRVKTAYQVVNSKLLSIVKDFPSFDNIHPFYRDLINTFYNINDIRKALGSLSGSSAIILSLMRRYINKIRSCNTPREAQKLRKSAFGRLASIVKKLDDRLHYLEDVRVILNHLPGIDPNLPTVVVAGAPNVGKSSLVKAISTAEPEIAEYPFTTRDIIVGKFKHNHIEVQVIDTPGLLDRPLSKRNKIELQAIAALKNISSLIIFMLDPSESCGIDITSQVNIYNEIKNQFSETPFFIVFNKMDIATHEQVLKAKNLIDADEIFLIVAISKKGVTKLLEKIMIEIKNIIT